MIGSKYGYPIHKFEEPKMSNDANKNRRSILMSKVRGADTRPEWILRCGLHRLGFRYRLHDSKLPGKPDIILPKYNTVIFFNGCFWHKHECNLFKWPKTRKEFWHAKLNRNAQKDCENRQELLNIGWRIMTIWECSIRGAGKKKDLEINRISDKIVKWLNSNRKEMEIKG